MKITPKTLKDWRAKHGISQRDAAKYCGVSRTTWQNWEYGIHEIQFSVGFALKVIGENLKT